MIKKIIFNDCIVLSEIRDDQLHEIVYRILKEKEYANQGVKKSNRKGFQTELIDNFYLNQSFTNKAYECLKQHYNLNKKTKILLSALWINKNYKDSYNTPHVHPKSNFSGVYFIDASEQPNKFAASGIPINSIYCFIVYLCILFSLSVNSGFTFILFKVSKCLLDKISCR